MLPARRSTPFHLRQAFGKSIGAGDDVVMLADPFGHVTKAMGVELDLSSAGIGHRCRRFAMLVDNGVVKAVQASS